MKNLLIENDSYENLLPSKTEELSCFLFRENPILVKVGTTEVLGEFRSDEKTFILELAQIKGEKNVLPLFWKLTREYAKQKNFSNIEWLIHAVHSTPSNTRLQEILQERGFIIKDTGRFGKVYYLFDQNF